MFYHTYIKAIGHYYKVMLSVDQKQSISINIANGALTWWKITIEFLEI